MKRSDLAPLGKRTVFNTEPHRIPQADLKLAVVLLPLLDKY